MLKKIIVLILFLFTCWTAYADSIAVDTAGWTQEEKNLMQAAAVSLLDQEGITYKSISISKSGLEIDSPSDDVSNILTSANLKAEGVQIIDTAEQYRQAEVAKEITKSDELKTNELTSLDIVEVDNKIDSLNSLADVKNLLKELLKYIKAKE